MHETSAECETSCLKVAAVKKFILVQLDTWISSPNLSQQQQSNFRISQLPDWISFSPGTSRLFIKDDSSGCWSAQHKVNKSAGSQYDVRHLNDKYATRTCTKLHLYGCGGKNQSNNRHDLSSVSNVTLKKKQQLWIVEVFLHYQVYDEGSAQVQRTWDPHGKT